MNQLIKRLAGAGLAAVAIAATTAAMTPAAASADVSPPPKQVLFYGPTAGGYEQSTAGIVATVWDEATWVSKTTADFAQFDAIVFGDNPACNVQESTWQAAIDTVAVWSPAVVGNVTINGTDPDLHGKPEFIQPSVTFAASGHGTGLYVSLSCTYHYGADNEVSHVVHLLDGLGTFKAQGVGSSFCPTQAHIVATHPSLDSVTDDYMSGWGCSAHEGFTEWPSNFSPLVIITDASTAPFTASDGTHGLVYVLASGARTSGLSVTPKEASGPLGGRQMLVARSADANDVPEADVKLSFLVTDGPDAGQTGSCVPATCLANSAGQVTWSFVNGGAAGDDNITIFKDLDGDGLPTIGEPQTAAVVHWDPDFGKYVALGDSYSSGEGVPQPGDPKFDTTPVDTNADMCHRSAHSYSRDAWRDNTSIPGKAEYWACSGATLSALTESFKGEDPQLDHVDSNTTLVTMTMGGNDAFFPDVLLTCVERPCLKAWDERVSDKIKELADHTNSNGLFAAYRKVKAKASSQARILVLGYPRFFPAGGSGGIGCAFILNGDERWINQKIHDMDAAIHQSALAAGVEYVDTENAFTGHELCNGSGSPSYMTGAKLTPHEYSFHPNALGQQALADAVNNELVYPSGEFYDVLPGATYSSTLAVAPGTGSSTFTSSWPGSTVTMSLVDPNGNPVNADDPSVEHVVTPTNETFTVNNPAPGNWTVKLFGTDVAFAGELTSLRMASLMTTPAAIPAAFTQSPTDTVTGQNVSYSADTTSDPALTRTYEWEFADGMTATGATVQHAYTAAGSYVADLVVTDGNGGTGFAQGDAVTVQDAPVTSGGSFFTPPTAAPSPSPSRTADPSVSLSPSLTPSPSASTATTVTHPLQLSVSPAMIAAGSAATAVVTGAPGQVVELWAYSRPSTTYSRIRWGTIGSRGTVSFPVYPRTNTRLFARSEGAASASMVVKVAQRVRLVAVVAGRAASMSGSVSPVRAGQAVGVYYRAGTRHVLAGRAVVAQDGTFTFGRTFGAPLRTLRFYAATAGDLVHAAGQSADVPVTFGS